MEARPEQSTTPPKPIKRRVHLRELAILGSVVFFYVLFGLMNDRFFGLEPLEAMLQSSATDGLVLIGMTFVIICGGFDLSVGSTMAAGGLTAALLMKSGTPVALAVLAALMMGLFVGWLNGLIITRLKVNPFITTLGMMSILRGIVLVVTKNNPPTGFPESFLKLAWGAFLGIPVPIALLVIAIVIADLLLRNLRYLRQAYFVGSNEEAAALTGIAVDKVKTFAFAFTGLLAALAGVIIAARGNTIDPNEGMGAELRVIAAVIVGGASLSGGRGTVLGSFLGLLLMQVITTGLVFINIAPEAQMIAVGLVLILAAMIDQSGASLGPRLLSLFTKTRNKKVERIFNVLLLVALAVVMVLKLGGGQQAGPELEQGRKQKYVMVAIATNASYWIDSKAGFEDKGAELGVEALFTGAPNVDANQQIDYIERAIAEGVDGIVAVPASDALTPVIDKAIAKGIPVVCVDTDAPSSKRFSFIGTGNYEAGFQGGEHLGKLLNGKGKVAILTVPGQDNLMQRVDGYKDALKKWPGIEVIAELNDQSSNTEGLKVARAILQSRPDLTAFACVEATGGVSAATAVKEANKVGKIKIVAMDRDDPTLRLIEEGVIDASVAQRSYTMTYTALQLLYNLRNGQVKLVDDWKAADVNPLPPHIDTGSFLITPDTAAMFYHEQSAGVGAAEPPLEEAPATQ